jgi:DNA-directed RNA polymerase subunit RPC12/RpoP
MILEGMPEKITCPHCGGTNCFVEEHDGVTSYLCMDCGYTTTSLNVEGSLQMQDWESTLPELIKAIKWVDPETNLVWLPSTLNMPGIGLVFPDGTTVDDWQWRAVPVVSVGADEKKKYPIPGKEGEYYTTKADFSKSKLFAQNEFQLACKHIGIIKQTEL